MSERATGRQRSGSGSSMFHTPGTRSAPRSATAYSASERGSRTTRGSTRILPSASTPSAKARVSHSVPKLTVERTVRARRYSVSARRRAVIVAEKAALPPGKSASRAASSSRRMAALAGRGASAALNRESARRMAAIFTSVSSNSASGVESATIPPPA